MPVTVRTVRGKPRLVEAGTRRIAKTPTGKAMDGGPGSGRPEHALKRQARAVNANLRKRKGT